MGKKIIIANWKMNPAILKEAVDLYAIYSDLYSKSKNNFKLIICPPFVYLDAISKIKGSAELGAQNCHWEDGGAFTGEISPTMLKDFGAKYIIIGHSERRRVMSETDEMINKKIKAVLRNEVVPVLAVGEREKEDDRERVLIDQLSRDLDGLSADEISKIIIAYEPVWSISTVSAGKAETPEHALESFKIIRNILKKITGKNLKIPTLYGGSIDSKNVEEFISYPEISGVLVGGASVKKDEFKKMIEIVSNV